VGGKESELFESGCSTSVTKGKGRIGAGPLDCWKGRVKTRKEKRLSQGNHRQPGCSELRDLNGPECVVRHIFSASKKAFVNLGTRPDWEGKERDNVPGSETLNRDAFMVQTTTELEVV